MLAHIENCNKGGRGGGLGDEKLCEKRKKEEACRRAINSNKPKNCAKISSMLAPIILMIN
jgi:hypothetical protein